MYYQLRLMRTWTDKFNSFSATISPFLRPCLLPTPRMMGGWTRNIFSLLGAKDQLSQWWHRLRTRYHRLAPSQVKMFRKIEWIQIVIQRATFFWFSFIFTLCLKGIGTLHYSARLSRTRWSPLWPTFPSSSLSQVAVGKKWNSLLRCNLSGPILQECWDQCSSGRRTTK